MENYKSYLPLIGRLLVGAGFLLFGYQKLIVFGPAGTAAFLGSVYHSPVPAVGAWVAMAVEILGGAAIVLGFQTRWVAAILALWCLATGLGIHLPLGDPGNLAEVFKNLVMAGGLVYIVAYGAGSMSIDGPAA
jgi:putative oxidoreductase